MFYLISLIMLKKISLLVTAVAFIVAINALSLQKSNIGSNESFI